MYKISLEIDKHIGHHQFAMSLLWHNVWLLHYSPSSNKPCNNKSVEMIGNSIAYWLDRLDYGMNIPRHIIDILYVICDELCQQHDKLCQLKDAMHRQEVRRSSPSPIPTTHTRGEASKSMSVVSVPSPPTAPLTLSSQIHSTRARMGAVTTQSVNVKHTDKLPPPDASPQRYEKSSSSPPPPISSTQERGAETKSMTVGSASSSSAAPLALSSHIHSTQARTGAVPTQSVSMPHTAKQPPEDASPRRREKTSYAPSQSTQQRGGGIRAKTSHSIYEVDKAVHIQRLWRSLKQRIRVRISRRTQQIRVLHAVLVLQHCIRGLLLRKQYERRSHTKQLLRQTSKHTQQVKAKQTQSNWGGNR